MPIKKQSENLEELPPIRQAKQTEAKIVEVPTQYSPAIQLEDGNVVDSLELQVLIYNKLLNIEKSVA